MATKRNKTPRTLRGPTDAGDQRAYWDGIRKSALSGARSVRGLARDEYEDCASHAVEQVHRTSPDNPEAFARKTARNCALQAVKRSRREKPGLQKDAHGSVFRSGARSRSKSRLSAAQLEQLGKIRDHMARRFRDIWRSIVRDDRYAVQAYRNELGFLTSDIAGHFPNKGLTVPDEQVFVEKMVAYRKRHIHLGGQGWIESYETVHEPLNTGGRPGRSFKDFQKYAGKIRSGNDFVSPEAQWFMRRLKKASNLLANRALLLCGFWAPDIADKERREAATWAKIRAVWSRRLTNAARSDDRGEAARSPVFRARTVSEPSKARNSRKRTRAKTTQRPGRRAK